MPHDFRREAAKALAHLVKKPDTQRSVIALPPSGLMGGYLTVIKKTEGLKIVLVDKPENILDRIVFYDVDSKPTDKRLTAVERPLYLREIKKDATYFKKSYTRADLQISIEDMDVEQAAHHILTQLTNSDACQS
jgi:shikimate kinase